MIVFSFGAIENHGKHLPLGCDSFQGNTLVKRVAEKLAEKGMPAVPGFAFPFGVQTNQFERTENFGNCYVSQSTLITDDKRSGHITFEEWVQKIYILCKSR